MPFPFSFNKKDKPQLLVKQVTVSNVRPIANLSKKKFFIRNTTKSRILVRVNMQTIQSKYIKTALIEVDPDGYVCLNLTKPYFYFQFKYMVQGKSFSDSLSGIRVLEKVSLTNTGVVRNFV